MKTAGNRASAGLALAFSQCLTALLLSACAARPLKTHPVKGRVELKDGEVSLLAGSHVELMADSDPLLRPAGKISSSGAFAVETLYQGKILPGAPPGQFKARIVLSDPSDEGIPKRKGDPIHKRFLDFQTSGLLLTVPSGDYTVALSKK